MRDFSTRIAGIPCRIEILGIDEYGIEWEVQDKRGRPAAWLERKMDAAAAWRIEDECRQFLQAEDDEARIDAADGDPWPPIPNKIRRVYV